MQIYISRDGEQNGPYSIEDVNAYLKDGALLPTDLACQEGMDEWVPISQIPGVTMQEYNLWKDGCLKQGLRSFRENFLGVMCMSTPAIVGAAIFIRSEKHLWAFRRN